ncbi:hypothetical protein [Micromonospora chalcea]
MSVRFGRVRKTVWPGDVSPRRYSRPCPSPPSDAQSATLLDRPAALAVIVGRLAACRYEEVVAASG